MTNITPNIMAQTNMSLLDSNYKFFQPLASSLFTYNGAPTAQTDIDVSTLRTLIQNMITLLPQLLQSVNNTPLNSIKTMINPMNVSPSFTEMSKFIHTIYSGMDGDNKDA